MEQESETSLIDHHSTDGGEGSTWQNTGDPVITSVFSLSVKYEEETHFQEEPTSELRTTEKEEDTYSLGHQDLEGRESTSSPTGDPVITSVFSLSVKHEEEAHFQEEPKSELRTTEKEEDTYSLGHQDLEGRESTSSPTDDPVITSVFSLSGRQEEETHVQEEPEHDLRNTGDPVITSVCSLSVKRVGKKHIQSKPKRDRKTRGDPVITSVYSLNAKHVEETRIQAKIKRDRRIRVRVTLDPDTASRWLILSKGRRQVRCGDTAQTLPRLPKRFTAVPCVLGREGFSSGKHYWEVQLLQEEGGGWSIGVARESVSRTGLIQYSPEGGIWAVRRYNGQYVALSSPRTPLSLCESPKKLGVYLDYEAGRLSLFNADTMEYVYTFTGAAFNERVFPYFCIGGGAELRLL